MEIRTTAFGYPKIGARRELKGAVESYWEAKIDGDELASQAEIVNRARFKRLLEGSLDYVPVNDFSLYDFMLDHSTMFGAVPERFRGIHDGMARYFAMARGHGDAGACEMTKWFDSNYHYIVPEFTGAFTLEKNRPLESYRWARHQSNAEMKPVIMGPFTYAYLGKVPEEGAGAAAGALVMAPESPRFAALLDGLAPVYAAMLRELETEGVRIVQLDEPALVYDLGEDMIDLLVSLYRKIASGLDRLEIFVHTYYESVSSYERIVRELPVRGIGLDFTDGGENYACIMKYGFPEDKVLIAGVLSGRSPWKTDMKKTVRLVEELAGVTGDGRLVLSNAAPLFHLPVTVEAERGLLDDSVFRMLAFADERLNELKLLKSIFNEGRKVPQEEPVSAGNHGNRAVRDEAAAINPFMMRRPHPFAERYRNQMTQLHLPSFPATTIGSFPQTQEARRARADLAAGTITPGDYEKFIDAKIKEVVRLQEDIGLDVLVHGEFERSDMVEFFARKMKGFALTANGWVQSYGTRCVRPPIIYGDVWRPGPMTVRETRYAQSLTRKPVKGILTGPVTILNWSFARGDMERREIAYQIALALREEVLDLESAGTRIIQIDEPAFREGLPLKASKRREYLDWAITAFRITNAQVRDTTQIQAHMCYSEFNEIIEQIYDMDADVMLIEGARNGGEILRAFEKFRYDHGIGIGVYDVHSPRVPGTEEIRGLLDRARSVIRPGLLWVNPDCGLKTRTFGEVEPSLRHIVLAARSLREAEYRSPAHGTGHRAAGETSQR